MTDDFTTDGIVVSDSAGWYEVPCPNCRSGDKDTVFTARNTRYGIDMTATVVRCVQCEMLRTDPQPDDASAAALYPDGEYYTHTDGARGPAQGIKQWLRTQMAVGLLAPVRTVIEQCTDLPRFSLRFAAEHFPLRRGQRLLDVGCGDGSLLQLVNGLGVDGIGLEPDPAARRAAESRGIKAVGSFDDCPGVFDRVVLRHVLEHVDAPFEVLRSVVSRLDDGGLVLVSVPNADSRQAEVFGDYWEGWDLPRHRWHFTAASLTQLCVRAGLRVRHLRTVELHAFATASNEHRVQQGIGAVDYAPRRCGRLESMMRGAELVAVLERQPSSTADNSGHAPSP